MSGRGVGSKVGRGGWGRGKGWACNVGQLPCMPSRVLQVMSRQAGRGSNTAPRAAAHSFTDPEWPGSLYMRLRVCAFQMYTVRSPLPAATCRAAGVGRAVMRARRQEGGHGDRREGTYVAHGNSCGNSGRHHPPHHEEHIHKRDHLARCLTGPCALLAANRQAGLKPAGPRPTLPPSATPAPWLRLGSSRSAAGSSQTCARGPQTPWSSGWRARTAACPTPCAGQGSGEGRGAGWQDSMHA